MNSPFAMLILFGPMLQWRQVSAMWIMRIQGKFFANGQFQGCVLSWWLVLKSISLTRPSLSQRLRLLDLRMMQCAGDKNIFPFLSIVICYVSTMRNRFVGNHDWNPVKTPILYWYEQTWILRLVGNNFNFYGRYTINVVKMWHDLNIPAGFVLISKHVYP